MIWILAPVAALVLALSGLRVGVPAYHHWQHERCLTRIAALEIDLGFRPAPPTAVEKWTANVAYRQAISSAYYPSKPRGIDREAFAKLVTQMGRNEITPEQYRERLRNLGAIK